MAQICCIIDGMTDAGFDPAQYPALKALPHHRWLNTLPPGREPDSLVCILTLLGYRDIPLHLRGYAEALGAGIAVSREDLILRASWVSLDGENRVTGFVEGPKSMDPGEGLQYHALGGYRGLLVLPGRASELERLVTHPPHLHMGAQLSQLLPQGDAGLRSLTERSRSGGRCLIPWGQSRPAVLPAFPQRAALITGTIVVRGIARMTGMDLLPLDKATGDSDTFLEEKLKAALQAARKYPFVLLHIGGADEAAHRQSPQEKHAFLRQIDQLILQPLLASPHAISVVSDHGTDPVTGLHQGGLQPLLYRGKPPSCFPIQQANISRRI